MKVAEEGRAWLTGSKVAWLVGRDGRASSSLG